MIRCAERSRRGAEKGTEAGGSVAGRRRLKAIPMETTTEGGEEEGKDEKDRGRGLPVLVVPAQFQAVQHTRAPRYITYESTPGPRRCVPTTTILTTSHHPSCSTSDTPKPRMPILCTHPPCNCLYAHDNPRVSTQLLSLTHKLCLMFPEDSGAVSRFFHWLDYSRHLGTRLSIRRYSI